MTPKFIEHISLGLHKGMKFKINEETNTITDQINTLVAQRQNAIDDGIFKQIHDIAVANDIDDVYVINKEAVVSALSKQIPKKPKLAYYESEFVNYHCTYCGEAQGKKVNKRWQKYCPHCGQALDWSDTE